jgi:hypothetical protein
LSLPAGGFGATKKNFFKTLFSPFLKTEPERSC